MIVMIFAFNTTKSKIVFSGFTLKWFFELFKDKAVLCAFFNSLTLGIVSCILSTIIGTLASLHITKFKKEKQYFFTNLNYIPIINSDVITGISLMLILKFILNIVNGEFGFFTVLISHITISMPYVVLTILPKIKSIDPNILDAALDLGCSPLVTLFKVTIPNIAPYLASALIMAFSVSFDDFTVSYFTTGASFQTLPVLIYSMVRRRITPKINALFTLVFILALSILIFINILNFNGKNSNKKFSQ